MLKVTILNNRDLKITAGNVERAIINDLYKLGGYREVNQWVSDNLEDVGFCRVRPEDIGALTSAPIFGKGEDVWWFPSYAVEDEWEILKNTGRVFFTKGE